MFIPSPTGEPLPLSDQSEGSNPPSFVPWSNGSARRLSRGCRDTVRRALVERWGQNGEEGARVRRPLRAALPEVVPRGLSG
ncbi:hypothetical protein NDU88_010191 [Pleurodeles waltl]|uniref:Uncharacterized protein n=1 Tax=Pleurodeles waltl TaxID=8319 RepID=A0AAV7RYT5_PLEWA|nr:hypothetical protein NDU88_010191 [Pleurodeles waltl]